MCGRCRHRAGVPPEGFGKHGVERRLARPLHEAQREVELAADVGGFVPGERERHEAVRFNLGICAGESAIQLVSGRSEFGVDGFGDLEGQGDHSCFGWLVVGW